MAKKKELNQDLPKVHKDLRGFDIEINTFGEISSTIKIDEINAFLNKAVDDKKLRHRKED